MTIRFVVGDPDDLRASTWRCWIAGRGKDDIYLAPRPIAGSFKVSLHESGDWRVAFTTEFKEKMKRQGRWAEGDHRSVARWRKPEQLAPGVVLAFRVIVPASAVSIPAEPRLLPGDLVWIRPPHENMAAEISLVLTGKDTRVTGWPGKRGMNNDLVGSLNLPSGTTLWLVSRQVDIPQLEATNARMSKFIPDPDAPLEGPNLRVFATIHDEAGVPTALFEGRLEVKKGNA